MADHLPRLDHVTDMNQILKMMGVNRHEVMAVLYLHNVAVAGLDVARRDDPRGGSEDGRPEVGPDVDPPVPPAAAPAERGDHGPVQRPLEARRLPVEVGDGEDQIEG